MITIEYKSGRITLRLKGCVSTRATERKYVIDIPYLYSVCRRYVVFLLDKAINISDQATTILKERIISIFTFIKGFPRKYKENSDLIKKHVDFLN